MAAADPPLAILGAGSWGTALAVLLARNGVPVLLWGHDPAHVAQLARERCNHAFLPSIELPPLVRPVADLETAAQSAGDVLLAVPSHAFAEVLRRVAPFMTASRRLAWATKGLEMRSGKLLQDVAREILGTDHPLAVISGPTFAAEVARGLPSAVTVAATEPSFAAELSERLGNEVFRAYTSDDMVGVQVGGAVKNVLAIAAGISDGLGFGANARAALITRGLAEMFRLGLRLGGQQDTFMGLAGLGDLVLTCTDDQSRNRRFGLALARGSDPERAKARIGQVVEGAQAAAVVAALAATHGVEMPITEQVDAILYRGSTPREAVQALFARAQKPEFG